MKCCKLVQENSSRNVHLLRYVEGDTFQWLETHGSLAGIECVLESMNEECSAMTETEFLESFEKNVKSEIPVFIADEPGMGKSELLVSLGLKLISLGNKLVLLINFKDFITRLIKFPVDIKNIMSAVTHFSRSNDFEMELVKFLLAQPNSNRKLQSNIMLDGLDEVALEQRQIATDSLKIMQASLGHTKIWVTLRDHMLHDVRRNFGCLGYKLEPFSELLQIKFIKEYWLLKFREDEKQIVAQDLENFARNLVYVLDSFENRDMIGTPLICWILAEIYEEQILSRNFLFELYTGQSFTTIYAQLVDKKFNIFMREKKGLPKELSNLDITAKSLRNVLESCTICLAISLIFTEDISKEFQNILLAVTPLGEREHLFSASLDLGIVQKLSPLAFIHRTFAEFIVARFIYCVLRGEVPLISKVDAFFQSFLWNHVLGTNREQINEYSFKFPALCFFLNSMLEENETNSSLTTSYRCELSAWLYSSPLDICGYSAPHLEKAQLFVACHRERSSGIIELMIQFTPVEMTYSLFLCMLFCHEYELMRNLMEKHIDHVGSQNWLSLQQQDENGFSILHWAMRNIWGLKSWEEEKEFLKYVVATFMSVGVETPMELKDKMGRTPFQLLLQISDGGMDAEEILNCLVGDIMTNVDTNDNNGNTLLHYAPDFKVATDDESLIEGLGYRNLLFFVDVLEYFQKHQYCNNIINSKNNKGHTPLVSVIHENPGKFVALDSVQRIFEFITVFKIHGADFNARDKHGNSVVHMAIERNASVKFIETLLECGSPVLAVNENGQTALHTAVQNNRSDVVDFLLNISPQLLRMVDSQGKMVCDYNLIDEVQKILHTWSNINI